MVTMVPESSLGTQVCCNVFIEALSHLSCRSTQGPLKPQRCLERKGKVRTRNAEQQCMWTEVDWLPRACAVSLETELILWVLQGLCILYMCQAELRLKAGKRLNSLIMYLWNWKVWLGSALETTIKLNSRMEKTDTRTCFTRCEQTSLKPVSQDIWPFAPLFMYPQASCDIILGKVQ